MVRESIGGNRFLALRPPSQKRKENRREEAMPFVLNRERNPLRVYTTREARDFGLEDRSQTVIWHSADERSGVHFLRRRN